MSRIFICYRREDSAGHAGRLFDGLKERFGMRSIFMDVAGSIEPGTDFVKAIDNAVGSCDALLVVIGPKWLSSASADGQRRLDDPDDFIRLETKSALERNIRVIPVLVQGARMPAKENLPPDLKLLARRQAIELSDTRWEFDVENLANALRSAMQVGTTAGKRSFSGIKGVATVAVVVVGILALWAIWSGHGNQQPRSTELPTAMTPGAEAEKDEPAGIADSRVEVPSVLGQSLSAARREIAKSNLTQGDLNLRKDLQRPPGTVIKQSPRAGQRIDPGTRVDLWVAISQVSQKDFDLVQALYNRHKTIDDCNEIRELVAKIESYLRNTSLVPEATRYSVHTPAGVVVPTIGHLATDRIDRIREAKPDCFR